MPNRHTFLNNTGNQNNGFKKKRGRSSNPDPDSDLEPIINRARIRNLHENMLQFNVALTTRNERRTIEIPDYINLLWIHFYVPFNDDLRKKFYGRYGLLVQAFDAFNRSVLFEVVDQRLFQQLQQHLNLLNDLGTDVNYTHQDYNLIALIDHFEFFDSRLIVPSEQGVILNIINSSQDIATTQQEFLNDYLNAAQISFDINASSDLYFIHEIAEEQLIEISNNFDIVQGITSSRPLTVRPGIFGDLRVSYGFAVKIPQNLPIIGIIDTGVNTIDPFENLVLPTINITAHPNRDQSGHGTLVAGLCIFGGELPTGIQEEYEAKCRVLPIKVLHRNTDVINFPVMLEAIRTAHQEHGVRIFNMSLTLALVKNYNETFSNFAYELDKLSYDLDILVLISVGNFDSDSLNELLTQDFHDDHNYPNFFYRINSTSHVHSCKNTNICVPSESMNNLSIGALAGNLNEDDQTDISPSKYHPAYYSRKSHFDYNQKINNKPFKKNQRNKYFNKPDLVYEGGDLHRTQSGIEVLADPGQYFTRTAGTSLSTPLVSSIAMDLIYAYPSLNMQSIKALLINSAGYLQSSKVPGFEGKDPLLKKLVGFGKPNKTLGLATDDHSITMILEKAIKNDQIMAIPIYLPEYLQNAGNKLIFTISLTFKFLPDRGNHLAYMPLHMSFNLVKNKLTKDFANKDAKDYQIKNGFSWSEDHFGLENALFSNAQKKEYRLQPKDIENLEGELAIAVRCICKPNIDPQLLQQYRSKEHSFSLVITITEEIKNETNHNLYSEVLDVNNLTVIPESEVGSDADLEAEN
ncbi:S8 family peptidase [Zunongwangia atlantica]|uniref:Peptidase s8 and s53 subtilisin kexin sedolisin n=1 Tax=Zunongwangia atlantica 22II14-10F7 TaxID=1185767 RepID=A0A1Y1SY43_9FLAO|nr:S8 family peptidase [Zunongwangia atlantica]ORL43667.1 peptidase s8 and s53 subtilisin kexin sedolisin [Zunongwangia atlantica 22II14-10F7]